MFKIKKPTTLVNNMGEPICVGNWKREKELGSGGFGVVNLWINKSKGECLAIKKCKWNLETHLSMKQRERWTSEVDMMKKIKNENIVAYRNMPEDLEKALSMSNLSGLPILCMEYCSLGNLRTALIQPQNCCGLPEIDVLYFLKDVSNALMHLHEFNVTHRDVKPENIVLQHCVNRKHKIIYKLIDLGYAKELSNETVSFVGTLQYLAPEIVEKQKYDRSVDYWSLAITAFEIICGIRPFLPTFTPWLCNPYLEKKASDVIAIQMTHTGDMELYKELLKENHLNMCLKQNMEKWLRSALEYDPQKRGLVENNNTNVFQTLQCIVSKKIITVFSVYTYEFYSYEVNESTLFSTLQDWIARDTRIQKADQFLTTSKTSNNNYAMDYYDEMNSESMIFVFKKDASISSHVCITLPKLIKILFQNIKTEFKCGTLKLLYAQAIYLISQETKHVCALKNAICYQSDCLKNMFNKENKLFLSIKKILQNFVSEIEFYNHIETSLFSKVYKDTNDVKLKTILLEYLNYMQQLEKIINIMNSIFHRHKTLITKINRLEHACNVILDIVGKCDFSTIASKATKQYEEIMQQNRVKNLTGGTQMLQIVSETIKIRDKLLKDNRLLNFLQCSASVWKELNKLIACMTAIQTHFNAIKKNLRHIIIEKLTMLHELHKNKGLVNTPNSAGITTEDLITDNTSLRYNLQELMDLCFLKHKNAVNEISQQSVLSFALENGTGDHGSQ